MNKPIYFSIIAVSLIIGLLLSFQFRSSGVNAGGAATERYQELTIEKLKVETDITQLEEEIGDLTVKIEAARRGRTEAAGAIEKELDKIKLYAGLIPVTGPGVDIVMKNTEASQFGAGFYSVRDEDLLKVINDLRGAGAEAISINDQRILATSEVRQAGNHINVNLVRLSPPYNIKAIGNPGRLKSSLEIKGGLVEFLAANGVTVEVLQSEQVEVPAYSGIPRFDYAKHVQRG
ncbi:MAG: hypothetical protein BWY65_00770 [Firmicutes bacterium ADurb.Bin373]|nr:DUF881 domain-containing protein [Bacillota bacterium]OQA10195.1 MAG: hypothetical protein BWY65_00770 [Firmicutes bacterium ADurb.Bin373]